MLFWKSEFMLLAPPISLEDRSCPLGCTPADKPVITGHDRIHKLPGLFNVVQCTECGLLRTNPRPTPDTIGTYYPDDYAPYQTEGESALGPPKGRLRRFMRALLSVDSRQMPSVKPGKLLELGCASGNFLHEMRLAGWQVQGIEFSPSAAQAARDRGFSVETGAVENAAAPKQPYDVIVAWMVLEHLHEPHRVLEKLREWIAPDGYLVFSVPDAGALERRLFKSRWYAWHLPNHLYHYTPVSIERLLHATGWTVERRYWQRNPVSLLRSMQYLARDRGFVRTDRLLGQLIEKSRYSKFRILLGWLLAIFRQSGRMEIWARPN